MNERGVTVNPPGDAHKMLKACILARRTVSAAGAQTYSKDLFYHHKRGVKAGFLN